MISQSLTVLLFSRYTSFKTARKVLAGSRLTCPDILCEGIYKLRFHLQGIITISTAETIPSQQHPICLKIWRAHRENWGFRDIQIKQVSFYFSSPSAQLPPSLDLPGFIGCLELATLNDDVISLYNFRNVYNIDTTTSPPCAR